MERKKRLRIMAVVIGLIIGVSGYGYARHHHHYHYSDGHSRVYTFHHRYWKDHLHFGLDTGLGRYIADGNWYGDPTVYPDTVSPSAPGVREHTKSLISAFSALHDDLSRIDATAKSTEDYVGKIAVQGDRRLKGLNSSLSKDAESGDALHKDKSDLSKYSTWVNPENRKEYLKLGTPISNEDRQKLLEDMPILDVKEASDFTNPEEWQKNDLKVQEYHRKVSTESTVARLQVLNEIMDLQKQAEKLLKTDFGNTLSDKQKMAMLQALRSKMKILSSKLQYINDTENEINEKYERKKKLENAAYTSGNIKYPALDPYHPTEDDKKRMSSSSKNFGFLSFSNHKKADDTAGSAEGN